MRSEGEQQCYTWYLTGVYGHPEASQHEEVWFLIKSLKCREEQPWLVLGNFNKIIQQLKKWGRRDRLERQMGGFREVLEDCDFCDLGFPNYPFTWCNNKDGEN